MLKKGLLFSTLSIILTVLFISLIFTSTTFNNSFNSNLLKIKSNSFKLDSYLPINSLEDYYEINYLGQYSLNNVSSFYYFESIVVPTVFNTSFNSYLNTSYYSSFGKTITISTFNLDFSNLRFNLGTNNTLNISEIVFQNITEINLSVYLNFLTTDFSLISSPASVVSGTNFNLDIFDNESNLVNSFSLILNQSALSQEFYYSILGNDVKIIFGNSTLSFVKDTSNVKMEIKELKYVISN